MQNIVFKELTKKVKKDESVINFVPCKIHYEGQGNVNEYFNHKTKSIKEEGSTFVLLKNSLYGRSLKGRDIHLGEEITGVVYKKEHAKQMDFEYIPLETFTKFSYWNHDEIPKNNDKMNEIISYLNIANEVNKETL